MTQAVMIHDRTAIPAEVLASVGLKPGDAAIIEATAAGVLIRPATLDEIVTDGAGRVFESEEDFEAMLGTLPASDEPTR